MNNYRWCKLYENMVIVLKTFKTLVGIILMTQPYYNSFKVDNSVFLNVSKCKRNVVEII